MKRILITTIGVMLIAAACNKQAAVQPAQNQTTSTDQTANWKTYTNTQYGFEFKYPATALVTPDSNTTTITVKDKNYEFHVLIENKKLETTHHDVPSGTTVTMPEKKIGTVTWYQGILDGPMANVEYNYALGNNKLSVLIWQYTPGWENLKAGESNTAFVNNLFTNQSSQDQILSTFKFTDSISTANWKTYTNTQYGYSIQYPNVEQAPNEEQGSSYNIYLGGNANLRIEADNLNDSKISDLKKYQKFSNATINSIKVDQNQGFGTADDLFITTLFYGSKYTYVLTFSDDHNSTKVDLLKQVLATFKFTK